MDSKVLVLGRGLAGLCLAYELLKLGEKPVVIGLKAGIASRIGQGMASTKGLLLPQSRLFADKLRGQHYLASFLAEIQRQEPLRFLIGKAYEPYQSEEEFLHLKRRVHRLQHCGLFQTKNLGSKALPDLLLPGQFLGAFRYDSDIWVDQEGLCHALEAILVRGGATLIAAEIADVVALPDGFVLQGGAYRCRDLFLGTGPDTGRFLDQLKVPHELSFTPGMVFRSREERPKDAVVMRGPHSLVFKDRDVFLGALSWTEEAPKDEDIAAFKASFSLNRLVTKTCLENLSPQTALRVRTPSRHIVWGPKATSGRPVWVLTGLHKSGLQLGPAASRKMAELWRSGDLDPIG